MKENIINPDVCVGTNFLLYYRFRNKTKKQKKNDKKMRTRKCKRGDLTWCEWSHFCYVDDCYLEPL